MRRAAAVLAAAAAVSSCGGEDGGGGGLEGLTVFAAASLTEAFGELAPNARFNFAGSGELAAQIEEGAPADVFASADPSIVRGLHEDGLVGEPRVFATNRLVLVVPSDNPAGIESLDDLRADGVKLVVGAQGVPAGRYARAALDALGATDVLDNVVSEEIDVKSVLGKVALGDADAGFVYATDARAAGDDVRTIELPAGAGEGVRYAVAVVADTGRRAAAEAFVARLLGEEGRRALAAAGFGLP